MIYRRFGKTELQMPVLTGGAMRYQASWDRQEGDKVTGEGQRNLEATLRHGLELGINHVETARGYGTSEEQVGRALANIGREKVLLQTKLPVTETAEEFAGFFEESLEKLQTDYVDLLSLHGLNNSEVVQQALAKGGVMEVAEKLRDSGRAKHIGFSTHGPSDAIEEAIASDRFEYVNLHWFYIKQEKWPAIAAATRHDMGIFIISPNDKGGRLYEPSQKLQELCQPLHPMAFNDLFCLSRNEVHTLSIGAAKPEDYDLHARALDFLEPGTVTEKITPILERLNAAGCEALGEKWWHHWHEGLPRWEDIPDEINIYEILRLYTLVKTFDMVEHGKARYNLLGNGGHWFPGNRADKAGEVNLSECLRQSPFAERIPDVLQETHELLRAEDVHNSQKE